MIHDFYSREMAHVGHPPVHLMVDTDLTNFSLNIRTFLSTNITFNEKALGSQFLPVPWELQMLEAEKIGRKNFIFRPEFILVNLLSKSKSTVTTNQLSDLDNLENSLKKLQTLLETTYQYTVQVLVSVIISFDDSERRRK